MEKNNLLTLIDNFQEIALYVLPIAVILLFLPITSEFFEFNKMAFVIAISAILLIVWAIKAIKTGALTLAKSPLDLGFGLLVLSAILSTIFSINKFSSLFGQYGKFFPNIFISVMLFALYYTIASNTPNIKVVTNAVKSILFASVIASIIGLLSYFNVARAVFPFNWAKGGGFNTLGSPITLGIVATIGFSIAITLLVEASAKSRILVSALYLTAAVVTGAYIISTNNLPTWAAIGTSLLFVAFDIYFYHAEELLKSTATKAFGLSLVALLTTFAIFIYIPNVSAKLGIKHTRTVEITLDSKTSWQITTSALRDYPLFGTGVSTYIIDFTRYKPLSFNNTPFWNLRFNKPNNEFFRIFSEQGLLGLSALIILILAIIKVITTSKEAKENFATVGISAAILGMLASFIFYSANTAIATMLITLLALLVSAKKDLKDGDVEDITLSVSAVSEKLSLNFGASKKEVLTYIFMGGTLLITVPTLFALIRGYTAEVYRKKALLAAASGNVGNAYNLYNKVISNNPFYDTYRRDAANIDIALVALIAQKGDKITAQDKSDMQHLVNQAAREVRLTTEKINPLSATNWEHRAWVFNQLTALDKNAAQAAMDAAQMAIQLDPLNPILRVGSNNVVGIGSIYYAAGNFQKAAISFSEAVQLKPDFANAYYNLSLSQAQLKNWEASATNMEIVLRLLPKNSKDFKIASENLKVLKDQAEKAREKVAKQQKQKQLQEQQPNSNATPAETEAPAKSEQPTQQ